MITVLTISIRAVTWSIIFEPIQNISPTYRWLDTYNDQQLDETPTFKRRKSHTARTFFTMQPD